ATNARLTEVGWQTVVEAAPGHVKTVRQYVVDALTPEQLAQLAGIADAILDRVDPEGTATGSFRSGAHAG
ncbi:MAG: MarR family transcriptional regulator, partial [Actinomycetes bacterium]